MFYKISIILATISVILANPGGYGGGGGHGGGGGGHGGGGGYGGGGGGGYGPLPYSFGYNVHGNGYGPHFGHNEKSNGHGGVYGSYSVALPDGRKQHVHYSAGGYGGYQARVSYSGKAQHPSYYGPAITFGHGGGGFGGGGYGGGGGFGGGGYGGGGGGYH